MAVDYGVMTSSMVVDLRQSEKLKTQAKHISEGDVAHTPEASFDQQKINTESGLSSRAVGLNDVDEVRPIKIDGPKPHYPLSSRRLREEGQVMVRLCIDSAGKVEKAHIQKSSGYPKLDQSALSALSKWRFSTSSPLFSRSFEECFRFPVRFTLEG